MVPPSDSHQEIVITQADINNLIRSKAGVFAAIKVLMESTQTNPGDIDAIYVAGGFGNFLNVEQAVMIGMLPDVPLDNYMFYLETVRRVWGKGIDLKPLGQSSSGEDAS